MVIYIDTFEDLAFDGVMFGKFKNWLLVISTTNEKVHIFTTTDERCLKDMMCSLIQKENGAD
jgi:hypothetical protein